MRFQKKNPDAPSVSVRRAYRASATYEFWTEAPETWTGSVEAASMEKAFFLAMRALRKAHPGRRPSSIVILIELADARETRSDGATVTQPARS